jgi:hypothetical protein
MYTMNENSEGKKKISVPKNGPALLPPESRRLRHVKSIMARSLEMAGSKILMDSFFTLHEEGTNPADPEHDEQPFFVGEVVYSSNVSTREDTFSYLRRHVPEPKPQIHNFFGIEFIEKLTQNNVLFETVWL